MIRFALVRALLSGCLLIVLVSCQTATDTVSQRVGEPAPPPAPSLWVRIHRFFNPTAPTRIVRGRVFDSNEQALPNASIFPEPIKVQTDSGYPPTTIGTNQQGEFQFGEAPGLWRIDVYVNGEVVGSQEVEIVANTTVEVVIHTKPILPPQP